MPGVSGAGAGAGTYVRGKYFGSLAPTTSSANARGGPSQSAAARVTRSGPSVRTSPHDASISIISRRSSPRAVPTVSPGTTGRNRVATNRQSQNRVQASVGVTTAASASRSGPIAEGGVNDGGSLRREEVERIVKRVASHYVAKLASLVQANKELQLQVTSLEGTVAEQQRIISALRRSAASDSPSLTVPATGSFIPAAEVARSASEGSGGGKRSGNAGTGFIGAAATTAASSTAVPSAVETFSADVREVSALRKALFAEKRQRLLVEEQTQRLAEQHAVLISTLEQRLHKQESQIREIIRAAENGVGGNHTHSNHLNGNASRTSLPHSTLSSPRQDYTPRHLLQQHLSQHQQTQEVLDKYRSLLGEVDQQQQHLEPIAGGSGAHGADQSLLLAAQKISKTEGLYETGDIGADVSGIEAHEDTGRSHLDEVQEITAFLDQITEQLEGLDDGESVMEEEK